VGWSGKVETLDPQHHKRINEQIPADHRALIDVPQFTLNTVLSKHDLKRIDYFCLDVEGGEFSSLKVFDFWRFDIDVFEVEDNFGNHPIRELMNMNGFDRLIKLGPSDIYRNRRNI
jgi:hypothetical protein